MTAGSFALGLGVLRMCGLSTGNASGQSTWTNMIGHTNALPKDAKNYLASRIQGACYGINERSTISTEVLGSN